ncbi:hypothetical protein [Actinosynnema sp. NPDC020468]|uniref:hypothetical protein n=1 Tax=Actinosynnema sp. NPDC020468 TaxID=3154488 RepID=UPI0033C1D6FE
MRWLNRVHGRVVRAVERVEVREPVLAVGRSLLALSTLATILFSADDALFPQTSEYPSGTRCAGVRALSMWCAANPDTAGSTVCRVLAVVVLAVTASGFRPAWTCVPHWYVTFSLTVAMPASNGGDHIAMITTMLLLPLCLGDDRRWQWSAVDRPLPARWGGSALAAHLALRGQVLVVYGEAALSKLSDPLWRQGSALRVISRLPQYGFPPPLRDLLEPVLTSYWPVALLGWSVIAVQLVIAASMTAPRVFRVVALVAGGLLHLGIVVLMNLTSFGSTMIAVLLVACVRTARPERTRVVPEERVASRWSPR